MMQLELVYMTGNSPLVPMPDVIGLELSPIFSDVGVVKFKYPKDGVNAQYVTGGSEFAVTLDGVEIPDVRFVLEEDGIDEAAEDGMYECQGRTMLQGTEYAVVHPPNWPSYTEPKTTYDNATPGAIMRAQYLAAQARGAMVGYTFTTWNASTDSNGQAWTKSVSIQYDPGVSLLSVLRNLVDQKAVEVRMIGRDIRLYNPDTLGVDLTTTHPDWILRNGRDTKDSPRKTSRKDLATVILVQGEAGYLVERSDSGAIATYGYRETFLNQSGITDSGTLNALGDATLGQIKQPRVEKTHGLIFAEQGTPKPLTNFNIGDWIYSDTTGTVVRYRIKQWTMKQEDNETLSGSVILNDMFADTVEQLVNQVKGITGQSVTGGATPVDTEVTDDTTIPKAPTGLDWSTTAWQGPEGDTWAQITATWNAVTQNTDDSAIDDLESYILEYGLGATPSNWHHAYTGENLVAWFSERANLQITLRVRAKDKNGNYSDWSTTHTDTTATDTTPPGKPSTPTVTAKLGQLLVAWDGLLNGGGAQPGDYSYTRIHMGTTSGFTPNASNIVGVFRYASQYVASGLVYDTTYYFKLITVDRIGNASPASDIGGSVGQGYNTPTALVRTDISAGSITYNEIAFKDDGNLIPDGSFENAAISAMRIAASTTADHWATGNTAGTRFLGDTYMTVVGSADSSKLMALTSTPVSAQIPVKEGTKFYMRFASRISTLTNIGTHKLGVAWRMQDGSTTVDTVAGSVAAADVWTQSEGTVTAPANATSCYFYIETTSQTAGTVYWDGIEVRRVIQTAIIDDLAVTNAKIADLAVNNAKINDLSADKINAGYLDAARIEAGTITAEKVSVGSMGTNLMPDGNFESQAVRTALSTAYWEESDLNPYQGTYTMMVDLEANQTEYRIMNLLQPIGIDPPGTDFGEGTAMRVAPGERYQISGMLSRYDSGFTWEGYVQMRYVDAAGTLLPVDDYWDRWYLYDINQYADGVWMAFENKDTYTVPPDAAYAIPQVVIDPDLTGVGQWALDAMSIQRVISGSMIVGGEIQGSTLSTGAEGTEHVFIDTTQTIYYSGRSDEYWAGRMFAMDDPDYVPWLEISGAMLSEDDWPPGFQLYPSAETPGGHEGDVETQGRFGVFGQDDPGPVFLDGVIFYVSGGGMSQFGNSVAHPGILIYGDVTMHAGRMMVGQTNDAIGTSGDGMFVRSGGATGAIYFTEDGTKYLFYNGNGWTLSGAGVYNDAGTFAASDERVKTNIEDLPDGMLDLLMRIRPRTFNRLDEKGVASDKRSWGVVAQELVEVLPDLVDQVDLGKVDPNTPDGEPPLGLRPEFYVEYQGLIPILIKSVQELTARVEELEARDGTN